MDQENQMEQHPVQCRNGCGFYSNAGTEGLCSICYKEIIKKKQQPPNNMPASLTPAPGAMASLSIDETSPIKASSVASSSQAASATSPSNNPSASPDSAGSPTVLVPSQADKRLDSESESMSGGAAAASDSASASPSSSQDQDGPKDGKKKKNRCFNCKKKVGLTGFTCRCGGLFCSIHRYSDKHECNFDYKELGAEEIRKSNPVIVAKKVQKI